MNCKECDGEGTILTWATYPTNHPGCKHVATREECPACKGSGYEEEDDE